jgi:hypothetical protein
LEQYLKFYQATADDLQKIKLENLFTMYLVAHCWEKMLRRIGNWSSQGCIFILGNIHPDMLRSQVRHIKTFPAKYAHRNNNELGMLVIWMVESGLMASVVMEPSGKLWDQQLLTDLATLFETGGDYNETTCANFHRLLIATLLAYGHALIALGSHKGESATFNEKYHHVFICASLLRQLVSSLMLRQHLWVCKSLLHTPVNTSDSLNDYMKYTQFPNKGCCDYMLGVADHDFTDEGDMDEAFLAWIRFQAAHLLALDTITRAFGSPDSKIPTVSLFAVQYPKNRPLPMEDWKVTVDDIFTRTSYGNSNPQVNAESVKKVIFERTIPTDALNRHPVFKNFKHIHCSSAPSPTFGNATMHCEIVLISLARYYSEILGETDRELIGLFEVTSYLPGSDAHPSDLLRRIWTKLSSGYQRRAAPFVGSSSASSGTRPTNSMSVAAILQFSQSSCHRGFPTK